MLLNLKFNKFLCILFFCKIVIKLLLYIKIVLFNFLKILTHLYKLISTFISLKLFKLK